VFGTTSNTTTNAGPFVIKLHGQSGAVPPGARLSFTPNPITPGSVTRMELTLGNQNRATIVDDVALTMILPPNVQIAATAQASLSGCGAATIDAAAGSNTVSVAGGRIGRGEQCLIRVNLLAPTIGSYTISTGVISSSNSGANSGASAVLRVANVVSVPLVRR
jgi:hypothetical protein